jgi:hypothetical protein
MYECSSPGLPGLLLSGRFERSAPAAPRGPSGSSEKLGDCTSMPYIGNSAESPHGRGRPGQPGAPPDNATVRPIPVTTLDRLAPLLAADRPLLRQLLGARRPWPPSSAGSTCSAMLRIARPSLQSALELVLELRGIDPSVESGTSSLGNTRPVVSRCRLDSPA